MELADLVKGRQAAFAKAQELGNAENFSQEAFDAQMVEVEKFDKQIAVRHRLSAAEDKNKESFGRISKPEAVEVVHEEQDNFSLRRAISCMVENNGRLTGLEAEVSQEIAKATGKAPEGFYVPLNFKISPEVARRVQNFGNLDTSTGTGFVETITQYPFIELLRNKTLVRQMGARVMTDLVGNVHIPRQTGAGSAYWIDADGTNAITVSNQTGDYLALTPGTLGANTTYTRNFLRQTSLDVEAFVLDDLSTILAIEMDRVAINGSGSGVEPTGILQNSSCTTVAIATHGGAPTWALTNKLKGTVDAANALNGSMAYLTTAQGLATLETTAKASNQAIFIADSGRCGGYPIYSSNQVPSNLTKGTGTGLSAIIFGDWTQCLYGLWGGLDVVVNPYTNDTKGSVRITLMQEADFDVRHAAAFAKSVDMITN